jgi:hypothetical protein
VKGLSASSGIELGFYVDIAEFTTHIDTSNTGDGSGCEVRIIEEYTLALGAAAGATVALNSHTWGPNIDKTTPIYYTTMADICAASKTNSVTARTTSTSTDNSDGFSLKARDSTMSVTTYTGVSCMVSSLNCPASQQTT